MYCNNKLAFIVLVTGIFGLLIFVMSSVSYNQSSAQAEPEQCKTSLSLNTYPSSGGSASFDLGFPVTIIGMLKCGVTVFGLDTITITGINGEGETITTDAYGKYAFGVRLLQGVHDLQAHFAGDNTHNPADSNVKTITIAERG